MRTFLTGATGYIGSAVLDAALKSGHQVVALVRDPEKGEQLAARGVRALVGELGLARTYLEQATQCDVTIHTAHESSPRGAAVDRQALELLLPALAAVDAPRVFLYTSSIWVLGSTTTPADESAVLDPTPLVAWRPEHERLVLDAHSATLRTVVIRPGIVYGGGRGIVSDLLKDALNGLIRVIGSGANHWPCIYHRDLADLYVRIAQSPDAHGVFHANDEGDERVNDIVGAIAEHVSQRPDVRHMPIEEAQQKLGAYADALVLDQQVRSPRARALGWTPTLRGVGGSVARLFEEFRSSRQ